MVFKRMLSALGVGAPSVDTVLTDRDARPGQVLHGHVHLTGGSQPAEIQQVAVSLVTVVEVEHDAGEDHGGFEFCRLPVAGPLRLAPGERRSLPFALTVPWETPVTHVYGQRLSGMTMGLRTEVAVAHAADKGDIDPVHVHPLPAQARILDALARLGFRFADADLEHGYIHGVHQTLPFYQEIEFHPAPQYAHAIEQVELTFVAGPEAMEVVLEFDRRPGRLAPGHDSLGHYTVDYAEAAGVDWVSEVDRWIRQAADHHQSLRGHSAAPGYPPGHGGHYDGYAHSSGPGGAFAAAAVGAAGGLVAGVAAGEILDEVLDLDDIGGDEGED